MYIIFLNSYRLATAHPTQLRIIKNEYEMFSQITFTCNIELKTRDLNNS